VVTAAPPLAADVVAGAEQAARLARGITEQPELAAALYHQWYLGRRAARSLAAGVAASSPMVETLAGSFRCAHAGAVKFESGWTVVEAGHDGTCVVRSGDRHRMVRPAAMIAPGGLVPRRGDGVAVRRLVDDMPVDGGFWHTFSDRQALDMAAPLSRVYFHATADGAVAVVAAITDLLIDAGVAWQLKLLSVPAHFGRPDSAVLYLEHDVLCRLAGELLVRHRRLVGSLGSATPPLARRVAEGMAWAAQPRGDDSFGDHRCQLLAQAALGSSDEHTVVGRFVAELDAAGIDASAPHRTRDREEPPWPSIS
jgi:hypothetical protein